MQSRARTVKQYIDELPVDRKDAIKAIRSTIIKNLPKGFEETMQYGMIGYVVPLKLYPRGYLGKKDVPLPFAAVAAQKNHLAIYLMTVYADKELDAWFRKAYKASGKKLDMGKSCIRFKSLEDVPLDVIGKTIKKISLEDYIELTESKGMRSKSKPQKKSKRVRIAKAKR